MGREPDEDEDAQSFKAQAETEYKASNLKSALEYAKRAEDVDPNLEGISEMVISLKILEIAAESPDDWYKILQVEPFAHINTIKKQYKKLALILHPDKNRHAGSEEAFKHVGEAFRFLSDKIRRKEYDMKLRIQIQEEKTGGGGLEDNVVKETFWTACSACKLSQQFEKSYLGQNLVCPSCRKSFKAVEAEADDSADQENRDAGKSENSRNLRSRRTSSSAMGTGDSTSAQGVAGVEKMGSTKSRGNTGDKVPSDEKLKSIGLRRKMDGIRGVPTELKRKLRTAAKEARSAGPRSDMHDSDDESIVQTLRRGSTSKRMNNGGEALEPSSPKRAKTEEMMTLAEMQSEMRRKARQKMMGVNSKEEGKQERREQHKEASLARKKRRDLETEKQQSLKSIAGSRNSKRDASLKVESRRAIGNGDTGSMVVEDSDFYDFDKDRVERSFKTGQVWAIYDDDDGMPRHYGLIEEVTSVNPFEVKMSWLDTQSNGDEELKCWEKMGFHVCCGRFKVSRQTLVKSLNIFSHAVTCERAAREIYRIYPRKGSVWALYKEEDMERARRTVVGRGEGKGKRYDLVVCLTSYSGMHGLSVAYLEKVEGLKTIFKRREVGCHAIKWVDGDEIRLFSHEIPARKPTGKETPGLPAACWELDPASLPPDLLIH